MSIKKIFVTPKEAFIEAGVTGGSIAYKPRYIFQAFPQADGTFKVKQRAMCKNFSIFSAEDLDQKFTKGVTEYTQAAEDNFVA